MKTVNLPKRLHKWNGYYYKSIETIDFVYYTNYQEGDDNGNTLMYRKSDGELLSDNIFATNDLLDLILERENEITWTSRSMKRVIPKIKKDLF